MIEIIERIGFRKGKAVTWEHSFDGGRTWVTIPWPYGELPFVLLDFSKMEPKK